MNLLKKNAVLMIGQDNFFSNLDNVFVDYISTGRSITPFSTESKTSSLVEILRVLTKAILGKYNVVVLPAWHPNWTADLSLKKKFVRMFLTFMGQVYLGGIALKLAKFFGQTKIVMIDRYDTKEIAKESLQYLSNVDIYLKSNLLKRYAGRQDSGVFFSRLPYWINCDVYPSDIAIKDKEYDVCFAGALNSNARQFAVDTLKRLADYDLNIYIPSENLDKKSYCQMLQKSWLALSPEGIGFHCFRHYEAMAMGAVPLINFPETDLITCHEDAVDVLFFNLKFEDFKEKIMNSLRDKEMLMKIILNNLANLEAKYSPRAVGKEILDLCDQLEQGLI
jgi:hypothetical protein